MKMWWIGKGRILLTVQQKPNNFNIQKFQIPMHPDFKTWLIFKLVKFLLRVYNNFESDILMHLSFYESKIILD